MRSLPGKECPSPSPFPTAQCSPSPLCTLPQRPHVALMPMGHLDPVREKTKMDNGHGQRAQMCPHHGPQRAWGSSVGSGRLLVTGLNLQPTLTWPEPTDCKQPCPLGGKADLPGAHWRSLWRDLGSEKLWMKDGAASTCGTLAQSKGAQSCTAPGLWQRAHVLAPAAFRRAPGWHHCPGLPGCQGTMHSPDHMEIA